MVAGHGKYRGLIIESTQFDPCGGRVCSPVREGVGVFLGSEVMPELPVGKTRSHHRMGCRFFVSCIMVTDPVFYASFKVRSLAEQSLSLDDKYKILDALYQEARRLGSFGEGDLQLGLHDDVRLASFLNANVSGAAR